MWSLVWWPHALAHGLNPFLTKIIWAPLGFNLTWSTTITLASLLFAPLTLTMGPVATYNVLCLMSLPIDALCAFILCRHITRNYSASLLGGYIFGFSPFMLGQLTSGHLHLLLAFSIPLSIYLVLLRTEEQVSRLNFILLLAAILFAQLLLSLEIFATITMFGALGLLLSWSFSSDQYRKTILDLVAPIACAYCVAMVAAAPYFYYFFIYSVHLAPDSTAAFFSTDPLNLLVPTPAIELGRFALFSAVSAGFIGGWTGEAGAYMSLPLLLIAVVFAYRHWPEREVKLLGYGLAAVILLSLGPALNINLPAFPFRIALPWWLLAKLPLLKNAYPARFTIYTFLLLAIISACYLARDLSTASARAILMAALVIFGLPNTSAAYWLRPLDTPAFFRDGTYRHYLSKGENVLILPYAYTGNSMLWQAQTKMYFDMAEGTTAPPPSDFRRWPIFPSLTKRAYVPDAAEQFKAFAAEHRVTAIIVADGVLPTWQALLSTLDAHPVRAKGVSIYRLPMTGMPDVERTWRGLRSRFDTERLTALIVGSENYLSHGGDLNSLTVHRAEESALISNDELVGASILTAPGVQDYSRQNRDPHFTDGVWIGRTPDGMAVVGEEAWYVTAAPLIDKLRTVSTRIYFPYPRELGETAPGRDAQDGWLLFTFTRAQLSQAAALLSAKTGQPNPTSSLNEYGRDGSRR